jgi:putative flippase GtrA
VGVINTAFGYGLYSLLVFLGLNLYIAQIVGHIIGTIFNYFMFRSHVFRDQGHPIGRYVVAYGFRYLMGVACLAVVHSFIKSPYLAGFVTLMITALANYYILKRFVFRVGGAQAS